MSLQPNVSTTNSAIDPIDNFLNNAVSQNTDSLPEPDLTADIDLVTDIVVAETPNGFAELGLVHSILASIEKSGYTTPTPIQAQAIPMAMAGRDLLLSAQTGSGKTAAFVLPILHKIAESKTKSRAVRALILTPTRELAYQVAESIRTYSAGMRDVFCVPLVGGAPYTGQIRALKKGVQIIVATPGRLLDHMNDGRINFSDLSMLVLDEADRMLDMGFAEDINRILQAMPDNRQTIMSSATWDGPVGKIAASFTRNPERIAIKVESAHIDEKVYFCDDFNHKNRLLEKLVCDQDMQQAIIFTATKRSSEQLAERLSEWGHSACYLHGDLPQSKRNRILADVKAGKYSIVVATDVAARGIDVPAISHVFNYDLPRQVEDYVHRIGRSGRAGRTGIAINLCSRDDRSQYHAINRYLKRDMAEATVEGLEPRFIESAYDRSGKSGKGRSGRNGRSSGSHNGGRDNKYSGFKGDANRGNRDGFKSRSDRPFEDRNRSDRSHFERSDRPQRSHSHAQDRHSRDDQGKMLTSHEFNFFNETRKSDNHRNYSDSHRNYDDRPRKTAHQGERRSADSRPTEHRNKPRHAQETHYNSGNGFSKERNKGFEGNSQRPQGERRHSGERSFDSAKPKRFSTENTYSKGSNTTKSHNTKGFEGRHFENSRKRAEAGTSAGHGKSDFQRNSQPSRHANDNSFSKGGDGQNAVKRSGRMSQRRDSTGKPI